MVDAGILKTPEWELRLKSVFGDLGARERRFGEYLLACSGKLGKKPIAVLAAEAQVSEATIVRLCHKMGYAGLKELKAVLLKEERCEATKPQTTPEDQLLDELKQTVFMGAVQSLQQTLSLVDNRTLLIASEAICKANHISIYAMGGSMPVARSLKHQFMKLGITSNIYNEFQPSIIAAEKYTLHDVAIAITNSGETLGVVRALESAHNKGAITICITNYANSSIIKCTDIPFYSTGPSLLNAHDNSLVRIAQTSLVNLLYACVAKLYTHYNP